MLLPACRSPRSLPLQRHFFRTYNASSPRSFSSSPAAATRRRPSTLSQHWATGPRRRTFHSTPKLDVVVPVKLADIGEGIVECEIIQWFVEPGARVEQFSPLCEVQSDKASSEISSKYSGVVKKLYYEPGDMARVGKAFVDIDTEDVQAPPPPPAAATAAAPDAAHINGNGDRKNGGITNGRTTTTKPETISASQVVASTPPAPAENPAAAAAAASSSSPAGTTKGTHRAATTTGTTQATPAVRHMSKMHGVDISQIAGTGKGGRVLKEDVLRFVSGGGASQQQQPSLKEETASPPSPVSSSHVAQHQQQQETIQALTPTQQHMFRTMTRSLTIPHFLYADEVDFSELTILRSRLNKVLAAQARDRGGAAAVPGEAESSSSPQSASGRSQAGGGDDAAAAAATGESGVDKLSYLPFIIKAVSLALYRYPMLNARVDFSASSSGGNGVNPASDTVGGGGGSGKKPILVHRFLHNIGVAMDTPAGLVVPVIKDVGSRNVLSIAAELVRLQKAALRGKLAPGDVNGGTITVSNIGNIGGTYVSPVIVEKEVAILGIGRMRTVPAFGGEGGNEIVRKQVCNFSWSADHRVIDGATMARAAELVRKVVEEPDVMVLHLR